MARMGKRSLSTIEIEQAKVLKASGCTYNAIGKELKRDRKTIKKALERPGVAQDVEVIRLSLADKWEDLANELIDSIKTDDITALSAYQRVISAGISTDKMRLLRGESTANVDIGALILETKGEIKRVQAEIQELDVQEGAPEKKLLT